MVKYLKLNKLKFKWQLKKEKKWIFIIKECMNIFIKILKKKVNKLKLKKKQLVN